MGGNSSSKQKVPPGILRSVTNTKERVLNVQNNNLIKNTQVQNQLNNRNKCTGNSYETITPLTFEQNKSSGYETYYSSTIAQSSSTLVASNIYSQKNITFNKTDNSTNFRRQNLRQTFKEGIVQLPQTVNHLIRVNVYDQ